MRSDKEQNLRTGLRRQFPLEQIAEDWNGSDARSTYPGFAFGVRKDAAHNSRSTIWDQHFGLHALSIDTGDTADCNTGIDGVVLDRDSENNGADISDLWCD